MSEHSGTPGGEDADAALAQLGRAITRAASALAAIPADDEATAYRGARALDAALGDLAELLRTVPRVAALGDPGPRVSQRLEQRRAELATARDEITKYREQLDDLLEIARNLADVTTESTRLRDRVVELERAQRLAGEIPGLRVRMKTLEEAVAAAGAADAPEIGARIAAAARQFAALTGRQREAIGAEADTLVAAADLAAAELDEQRVRRDTAAADLERRETDAAQLAADHREMLPVLTAWTQADADLADGLQAVGLGTGGSALQTVRTELDGIRQRLADLDELLRPLLAAHARAYEDARQVRSL
jgi:chromosome segregation ATPase